MKKRVLIAVLVLFAGAILAVGFRFGWNVCYAAWRALAGPERRPLRSVEFERTEGRRQRGQYLAEGILACFRCHSDRDWSQPGGPVPNEKKGAGHVFEKENIPGLVAPNITPDLETAAGKWTDDMLAGAI